MATQIDFPQSETQLTEYENKGYFFDPNKKVWFDSGPEPTIQPIAKAQPITEDTGALQIPQSVTQPPVMDTTQARMKAIQASLDAEAKRKLEETEQIEKDRESAQERGGTIEGLLESFSEGQTVEQKREAERAELGLDVTEFRAKQTEDIAEVASLLESYDLLVAKQEGQILQKEQQTISQGLINKQTNALKKEQNIELSLKAAQIKTKLAVREMLDGNFEDAQRFVEEAVNDFVYDKKLEYDQLVDFREENQDAIADLDKKYQTALEGAEQSSLNALSLAQGEAEQIGDLMLDNPTAGIDFTDTIEEATIKASKSAAIEQARVRDIEERELRVREGAAVPTVVPVGTETTIEPAQLSPLGKAVFDGTIGLKDITPSQRAQIAPELNAVGFTAAIDAEAKQDTQFIINQMDTILDRWEDIPGSQKGQIQGRISTFTRAAERSPQIQAFDISSGLVGQFLAKLVEKNRLSDQDRLFYLSKMPNINQSKEAAEASVSEVKRLLQEKLSTQVEEIATGQTTATQADRDYVNSLTQ